MLNRNFTPFPVLTTERLTLRQLAISDEQQIFTLRSDREINKYLDRPLSNTIDDARNFINKINAHINNNDSLYWAIAFKDKHILVGTVCLFSLSDQDNHCETGFELLPAFQGQGIMKEALEKVIDYAFHTIKVQQMEACFHPDNQRSKKLLEKCSFRKPDLQGNADPGLICYHLINSTNNFK